MCLCEKAYPKRQSFAYLEEIQQEFNAQHGADVVNASRPFQFIKFGTSCFFFFFFFFGLVLRRSSN